MALKTIQVADKPTLDAVNQKAQLMSNDIRSIKENTEKISVVISGGTATGIPPKKMINFHAQPINNGAILTFEEPNNTVIDGQNICNVKGCMVRVSTEKYPETITEGSLVLINTDLKKYKSTEYEITGLTNGTQYYFTAFPYSDHSVYNLEDCEENKEECTPNNGEKITVSIETDDGSDLEEVTISLVNTSNEKKSKQYTSNGAGTYNFYVESGESYYIETSIEQNHIRPDKTQTYTASGGKTRNISMQYKHFSTFAQTSWSDINKICIDGLAEKAFEIGDEKTISIDSTSYTVVILDFNHDEKTSGGKAGLTIGLKNGLANTYAMNSSDTNVGGWGSCALRNTLQNTIFNKLPTELKNVIKKVNKLTSAGNRSTTINKTSDDLFLFSEIEVFGTLTYSAQGEGTQYPYFASNTQRIKKLGDSGSANYWWERSPYLTSSSYFCVVNSSGAAGNNYASTSYGVSFGFCI